MEIPRDAKVLSSFRTWDLKWGNGYEEFIGKDPVTDRETKGYFKQWVDAFSPEIDGEDVREDEHDRLYFYKDGAFQKAGNRIDYPAEMPADARVSPYGSGDQFNAYNTYNIDLFWSDKKVDEAKTEVRVFDAQDKKIGTMYPYGQISPWGAQFGWENARFYTYGHIFYFRASAAKNAGNGRLFKMLAADRVDCDSNESSYLNSINHVLSLLGFTYQEMASGKVYMTKDILLSNFGFNTAGCSEALWNN